MKRDDPRLLRSDHWLRAAGQRLTAAQFLFDHGYDLESSYLAGYVVESALKAVILAATPSQQRRKVVAEQFRGEQGHNYDHLRSLVCQRGVSLPQHVNRALRRINTWQTLLRYETGRGNRHDAEQYLQAANDILQWSQRSAS